MWRLRITILKPSGGPSSHDPRFFEYYAPRSLSDAVKYLSAHRDDVKILSGGQSLLPLMKMRLSKPGYILDIGRVSVSIRLPKKATA